MERLADYLQENRPDLKGYGKRSLYRYVQFYETYSNIAFVSAYRTQIQIADSSEDTIVSDKTPQIDEETLLKFLCGVNWTVHRLILSKCPSPEEKMFYISLSQREQLTEKALDRQIDACVFERILIGNTRLNKLKKYAPEAFYYWLEIELLLS